VPVVAVIMLVGWIAFWVYWLAAAATGTKTGRTRWGQFAGVRVALVFIVLLLVRTRVFRGHMFTTDPWLQGIGLALFLSGLALAIWARRYLGQNWGMPMSEKENPELVTTGPYRRIRHPIYAGIVLAMIGTAVAVSWYWLIVAVVIGAYFIYSAVIEERYMTGVLPDTYPAYQRSTRMLLPFIF
jgi:protein-S-isoprenylcysteine O-methyltransferase Ste14